MRKNTVQVFGAWLKGDENRKQNSIWTDGDTIYSYGTAIATHGDNLGEVFMNRTKYSNTTSQHQNNLAVLFPREGYEILELNGLPIGTKGDTLFRIGRVITW
jgi:hypothetical protein